MKNESGLLCFQETTLGVMIAYGVLWGGFIQIVHDGFGYWLTIRNIEATSPTEVFDYDSTYASNNTNVKQQIAAIMARPEEKITVKMIHSNITMHSVCVQCSLVKSPCPVHTGALSACKG